MRTVQQSTSQLLLNGTIESWQSRLLQLDRRNNLLYFNENSKTAVRLKANDLDALYRSVAESGSKGLQFSFCKTILNNEKSAVMPGQLDALNCTVEELQKRLSVLRRRDREWEEEQGTNVLYLAFGLLEWIDQQDHTGLAPLLLLPADLLQASPREPFFVSREPEELVLNSTLVHQLSKLGWSFPDLDSDAPISEFLSNCETEIRKSNFDFRIRREAYLACFAYSKLGMWTDIQNIRKAGTRHLLLRAMLGGDTSHLSTQPRAQPTDNRALLCGGHLDDFLAQKEKLLILPADYSQSLAIHDAQLGHHLIIHGPPGTGKSQTIANLIGALLADGKRVLFVSEKTAALDVVKKRLDKSQLGIFCLDLHSERGKRSEAYEQLAQSICYKPTEPSTFFPTNRFKTLQTKLNKFAQALHHRRTPLNKTVFEVHGRLALLKDVPEIKLSNRSDRLHPSKLTEADFNYLLSLCFRLQHHQKEFFEHQTSFWKGVLYPNLSPVGLSERLKQLSSKLLYTVESYKSQGCSLAKLLGLSEVRTPVDVDKLIRFAKSASALLHTKDFPSDWAIVDREELRSIFSQQKRIEHDRQTLLDTLGPIFSNLKRTSTIESLEGAVDQIEQSATVLQDTVGHFWLHKIDTDGPDIVQGLRALETTLEETSRSIEITKSLAAWGQQALANNPMMHSPWSRLDVSDSLTGWQEKLLQVENTVSSFARSSSQLCKFDIEGEAYQCLVNAQVLLEPVREIRRDLSALACQINLANELTGIAFENWYTDQSTFEWLARTLSRISVRSLSTVTDGSTGHFLSLIRSFTSSFKQLQTAEEELERFVGLEILHSLDEKTADDLSTLCKSRWYAASPRYHSLKILVCKCGRSQQSISLNGLQQILSQVKVVLRCRSQLKQLQTSLVDRFGQFDACSDELLTIERELVDLNVLLDSDGIDSVILKRTLNDTAQVSRLLSCQRRFEFLTGKLVRKSIELQELLTSLTTVNQINQVKSKVASRATVLNELLEPISQISPFLSHATNIENLKTVTRTFTLALSADHQYSENMKKLGISDLNQRSWDAWLQFLQMVDHFEKTFGHPPNIHVMQTMSANIAKLPELAGELVEIRRQLVYRINQLRQILKTPWTSAADPSFSEINTWLHDCASNADNAPDFLHYQGLVYAIDSMFFSDTVNQLRLDTHDARNIHSIMEKYLLRQWLDCVCSQTPVLREFDASEHEKTVEAFTELDRGKAPSAASTEIRRRLLEKYPSSYAKACKFGELSIIIGEIRKHRRKMPLRSLIEQAPHALLNLKPCFMMSPLAVSQYLPNNCSEEENYLFDVLIFDEASQIFPEDAIPAIARCKQIIVVGDEQQLPPSNFFNRTSELPDDVDEDDEPSINSAESILSSIRSLTHVGVSECYLNMHYRSRHESLIRFSNRHFYNGRLLTFPGPDLSRSNTGIRDYFVVDGLFDAGKTRRNVQEAGKVVDFVFEHFSSYGAGRSVGVVALSRTQADFIHELIIERRKSFPEFDQFFAEDCAEPFFVKNLENVQGDERDHIILSIGYGPTEEGGKVPNRFGPINSAGGERRLNVAISRARYNMTLVRSLHSSDIRSEREGPILLRKFIEYCENSIQSGSTNDNQKSTNRPDLIRAVMCALEELGFVVRDFSQDSNEPLDLAILSKNEDRYDLGLMIDGPSFYSAPTARDREWLRTTVMENIGWRLYRVWSKNWLEKPSSELKNIVKLVELIRESSTASIPDSSSEIASSGECVNDEESNFSQTIRDWDSDTPMLFIPYRECSLSGYVRTGGIRAAETISDSSLTNVILKLAQDEGPLHFDEALDRMRTILGVGRIGNKIRSRIVDCIQDLHKKARIRATYDKSRQPIFIYAENSLAITPRRSANNMTPRKIERISREELESGLIAVLSHLHSLERDDLIKEASQQFGYNRLGTDIQAALARALKWLMSSGRVIEKNGVLLLDL